MKTVKQLNQEAGQTAAHVWLESAEKAIADGSSPLPLSKYSRECFSINLIPEWFKLDAQKQNPRWWCNERNWKAVQSAAIGNAQQVLQVLGKYPLTLAHFSVKKIVPMVQCEPPSPVTAKDDIERALACVIECCDKASHVSDTPMHSKLNDAARLLERALMKIGIPMIVDGKVRR